MNRVIALSLFAGLIPISMVGCNETDESSTKRETEITTPGGTTTITTEKEIKKSGDNPPAANP